MARHDKHHVALLCLSVLVLDPCPVRSVQHGDYLTMLTLSGSLAFALKKIRVQIMAIDLEKKTEEFLSMNPSGNVPSLRLQGPNGTLDISQSMAILEYIEETWPDRGWGRLLPVDPAERATVRAVSYPARRSMRARSSSFKICQTVVCDIQPAHRRLVQDKIASLGGNAK